MSARDGRMATNGHTGNESLRVTRVRGVPLAGAPFSTTPVPAITEPEPSCAPGGRPSSALANKGLRCLARGDVCLKLKNGSSPHRGRSVPVQRQLDNASTCATVMVIKTSLVSALRMRISPSRGAG